MTKWKSHERASRSTRRMIWRGFTLSAIILFFLFSKLLSPLVYLIRYLKEVLCPTLTIFPFTQVNSPAAALLLVVGPTWRQRFLSGYGQWRAVDVMRARLEGSASWNSFMIHEKRYASAVMWVGDLRQRSTEIDRNQLISLPKNPKKILFLDPIL